MLVSQRRIRFVTCRAFLAGACTVVKNFSDFALPLSKLTTQHGLLILIYRVIFFYASYFFIVRILLMLAM